MGVFCRGPDTLDLMKVTQLVGLFYTLPRSELRQSRKDWVKAWKATKVSAASFVVERYGLQVTDDGDIVPTRGPAVTVPLSWNPGDGFGPQAARRFIDDVRSGWVPATDE